jgi:hypothetical protein
MYCLLSLVEADQVLHPIAHVGSAGEAAKPNEIMVPHTVFLWARSQLVVFAVDVVVFYMCRNFFFVVVPCPFCIS